MHRPPATTSKEDPVHVLRHVEARGEGAHAALERLIDEVFGSRAEFARVAEESGLEGYSASNLGRLIAGRIRLTRQRAQDIISLCLLGSGEGENLAGVRDRSDAQIASALDDMGFGSSPRSTVSPREPLAPGASPSTGTLSLLSFEEIRKRQEELLQNVPDDTRQTILIISELPLQAEPGLPDYVREQVRRGVRYLFILRDSPQTGGRRSADDGIKVIKFIFSGMKNEEQQKVTYVYGSELEKAKLPDDDDRTIAEVLLGPLPKNVVLFTGEGFAPYGHAYIPSYAPDAYAKERLDGWYYLPNAAVLSWATEFSRVSETVIGRAKPLTENDNDEESA